MISRFLTSSPYHTTAVVDRSFIGREVLAGLTTFLTMSYILAVQPSIMKAAGMDVYAVTAATALVSALATAAMALFARLPYALAPGMGGNAFMAFSLVAAGIMPWQTALGVVFWAGVFFLLLTTCGLRGYVAQSVPLSLKYAIGAGIGFFIAQLGFKSAHLILFSDKGVSIGDFQRPEPVICLLGLVLIAALKHLRIRGEMVITIAAITLLGIPLGLTHPTAGSLFSLPPSLAPIAFQADLWDALKWGYIPVLLTFFFGDFFSTLGTLLGVSAKAGFLDKDGNLPHIGRPFLVDALATCGGALLGLTTVTTFVESSAGIESGGRTPLTSLVVALLFLSALFIVPLIAMVPSIATAPVLIFIGFTLASLVAKIDMGRLEDSLPAFVTIGFTIFTSSIANGITFGILSYVALHVLTGRPKEVPSALYVLCLPLIFYVINL